MRKVLYLMTAVTATFLWGCHSGKKSIPADGPITFNEFLEYFPQMVLPYKLDADTLVSTETDSLAIPLRVIRQFFPDTVFKGAAPGRIKTIYYPEAISADKLLYYLVIKTTEKDGSRGYLCLFSRKGKFLGSRLIGSVTGAAPHESTTARIGRKYTVTVTRQRKVNAMQTIVREDVYVPNPDGSFSLILTNTNEPAGPGQIINPIDTLPRKHKYSGNYTAGKPGLVAIRDGATPGSFRFFIHFSRDGDNCAGELEGTGKFTGAHTGEFHEEAGPCGIHFDFTATAVTIREIGGCGAYRGIKCLFEGVFRRPRPGR